MNIMTVITAITFMYVSASINMEQQSMNIELQAITHKWVHLPLEMQDYIRHFCLYNLAEPDLEKSVTNIDNFARVDHSFHDFINKPKNIKLVIIEIAKRTRYYNELHLMKGLRNIPGIQTSEIQKWKKQHKKEIPHKHFNLKESKSRERLMRMLENGFNINTRDRYGNTVLLRAIRDYRHYKNSRDKIFNNIQFLLALDADVNMPNKNGITPWALANHFKDRHSCIREEILKYWSLPASYYYIYSKK